MVTKENRTALLGLWINRIKHKLKNTETPPLQSYPGTVKSSLFQKYLSKKKKHIYTTIQRLPPWLSGKESAWNAGDMQKTWIWSLDWENLLEKEVATHSSILFWEFPWTEGAWWATVHGVPKSLTQLSMNACTLPSKLGQKSSVSKK